MASGGRRRKPRAGAARCKHKKRTKYLSLSRIFVKAEVHTPPEDDGDSPAAPSPPPSPAPWEDQPEVKQEEDGGCGQQADPPFAPLHHEASTLFAALPAPSLSDILGASTGGNDGDESPSPSASPAGLTGAEEEDLARRALRGRERWVYCCSSASASPSTTSASSPCSSAASTGASARGSLLLKLDYDEILAAWADRGSLYIAHAAPKQEEPDPDLDNVSTPPVLFPQSIGLGRTLLVLGGAALRLTTAERWVQVLVEVEPPPPQPHPAVKVEEPPPPQDPSAACGWTTPPETAGCGRAESVRRYREKRRNRLFDHRIRYEIRRANAVKRPRFKVTLTPPTSCHY